MNFSLHILQLHFKQLIENRDTLLLTDHKPFCSAFSHLHLNFISEYVTYVSHIRGHKNIIADCLFRPANIVTLEVYDIQEIINHQKSDEELQQAKDNLKPYKTSKDEVIMYDISPPFPRPFFLQKLWKSLFDNLHSLLHPRKSAILRLINSRYY